MGFANTGKRSVVPIRADCDCTPRVGEQFEGSGVPETQLFGCWPWGIFEEVGDRVDRTFALADSKCLRCIVK